MWFLALTLLWSAVCLEAGHFLSLSLSLLIWKIRFCLLS